MIILLAAIIIIHGLIHLLGFAKAFNLAELEQLTKDIPKAFGIIWIFTTLLFYASLVMYLLGINNWWFVCGLAIVFSQASIINSWRDAKWGTLTNIIILIPVLISFMQSLPSDLENIYKAEVMEKISSATNTVLLLEEDIQHLPSPVKKYLKYTGAIGKPVIKNFMFRMNGKMRFNENSRWMAIGSEQHNEINSPSRFFYIRSKMFGIPFDGLHIYNHNGATMKIKIASMFEVVDAKGKEMNISETVTFFNDMCIFAPSGLANKSIGWRTIDSLTAEATFTYLESTIKAHLFFNEKGELLNFVSNDRYQSTDGIVYKNYKWSTPVKNYKEIKGRRIPTTGEAIWHMPEGDFSYALFNLKEIKYNL